MLYFKWNNKKLDDLFEIANKGYGNALNQIGFKLGENEINLPLKKVYIEHLLYRMASLRESAVGMFNAGYCLEEGYGVKPNYDMAA